jgi:hypothetical protein
MDISPPEMRNCFFRSKPRTGFKESVHPIPTMDDAHGSELPDRTTERAAAKKKNARRQLAQPRRAFEDFNDGRGRLLVFL